MATPFRFATTIVGARRIVSTPPADSNTLTQEGSPPASILIVPNYAFSLDTQGRYGISPDQRSFATDLQKHFPRVGIAALERTGVRDAHVYGTSTAGLAFEPLAASSSRPESAFRRLLTYVRAARQLYRVLGQYDLVYIYLPGWLGLVAYITARLRQLPYACYVRGGLDHGGRHLERLYRHIVSRSRFCLCTGPALLEELRSVAPQAALVSPMLSIDISRTAPARQRKSGGLTLLFVGQLREDKGAWIFLELASLLRKSGVLSQAIMAGSASDSATLERLQARMLALGIHDVVRITGFIRDPAELAAVYAESDLLVLPTTYNEGFPRVIYEAMLLGVPVMTYQRRFCKGLLANDRNSVLAPVNDLFFMHRAAYRLAQDHSKLLAMANEARRDVFDYLEPVSNKTHADQVRALVHCSK